MNFKALFGFLKNTNLFSNEFIIKAVTNVAKDSDTIAHNF